MPDRSSFLRTILAHPDDDGPRLVYADWLEECGECVAAELVRASVKLASHVEELPVIHVKRMRLTSRPTSIDVGIGGYQEPISGSREHVVDAETEMGHVAGYEGKTVELCCDGQSWRSFIISDIRVSAELVGPVACHFRAHANGEPKRRTLPTLNSAEWNAVTKRLADLLAIPDAELWSGVLGLPIETEAGDVTSLASGDYQESLDTVSDPVAVTIDRGLAVGVRCSWDYCREHLDAVLAAQPVVTVELTERPRVENRDTFSAITHRMRLAADSRWFALDELLHSGMIPGRDDEIMLRLRWPQVREFELPPAMVPFTPAEQETVLTRLRIGDQEIPIAPVRLRPGESVRVTTPSGGPVEVTTTGSSF